MVGSKSEKKKNASTNNQTRERRKLAETELQPNEASRGGVYLFSLAMFALGFCITFFATIAVLSPLTIAAAVVVGIVFTSTIRVAPHWERVAVLRFG